MLRRDDAVKRRIFGLLALDAMVGVEIVMGN
jgi:hypothetical protein